MNADIKSSFTNIVMLGIDGASLSTATVLMNNNLCKLAKIQFMLRKVHFGKVASLTVGNCDMFCSMLTSVLSIRRDKSPS